MRRLALIALILVLPGAAAAAANAAAPNPLNQARLDLTIRYLQEAQNLDGGFGGEAGGESTQGISAWVALALAAGGVNPRCQARPSGLDAFEFLAGHFQRGLEEEITWPTIPTTALERELMVVNAAGADPHSFAGHDLVAEILARAGDDGSFPFVPDGQGQINDTAFAVLALAPVHEPAAEAAIRPAADWLASQQNVDGGWPWAIKGKPSEGDLTGAVVQALRAAGRADTQAERRGLEYLRAIQLPDGGFPEFAGEPESNVASTAWAAQGIWAVGQDPEAWIVGGREPLAFLASLQQPDGRLRWKASQDLNGVWMTAYAAPAFAGQTWPIPHTPCAKPPPSTAKAGQGEGTQAGRGVIAGGGGHGAPLFSRPKPQSKGKTPGGARIAHEQPTARNRSRTRRGENALQSTATVGAEPEHEAVTQSAGGGGSSSPGGGDGGGRGAGAAAPALPAPVGNEGVGREVSGTLVGTAAGRGAAGAPGLHSAGVDDGGASGTAIAIAAAAAMLALIGSQWDRRRGGVYA